MTVHTHRQVAALLQKYAESQKYQVRQLKNNQPYNNQKRLHLNSHIFYRQLKLSVDFHNTWAATRLLNKKELIKFMKVQQSSKIKSKQEVWTTSCNTVLENVGRYTCCLQIMTLYFNLQLWNAVSFQQLPSVLWRCWLGGRKGIRPVKNRVGVLAWLSVCSKVQTCIWPSWRHCHSLSLASVKSRLVLSFWYQLTRVVLEKGR